MVLWLRRPHAAPVAEAVAVGACKGPRPTQLRLSAPNDAEEAGEHGQALLFAFQVRAIAERSSRTRDRRTRTLHAEVPLLAHIACSCAFMGLKLAGLAFIAFPLLLLVVVRAGAASRCHLATNRAEHSASAYEAMVLTRHHCSIGI